MSKKINNYWTYNILTGESTSTQVELDIDPKPYSDNHRFLKDAIKPEDCTWGGPISFNNLVKCVKMVGDKDCECGHE